MSRSLAEEGVIAAQETHFLKEMTFLITWFGATYYGRRDPHNFIYKNAGQVLILGSVLLMLAVRETAVKQEKVSSSYDRFRLKSLVDSLKVQQKLLVIQVLEEPEANTFIPNTSLKAATIGTHFDGRVTVERLPLVDFSHAATPSPKYISKLLEIIRTKILGTPDLVVYCHCKAGVNRSFRTSAIIKTILEFEGAPTAANISQRAWATCRNIQKERPCVDFTDDNCLVQASFICCVVATFYDLEYDESHGFIHPLLKVRTEELLRERIADTNEYKTSFGSLFGVGAISRSQKINALEVFSAGLNDKESDYSAGVRAALENSKTAKLITTAREHQCLPSGYDDPAPQPTS